MSFYIPSTQRAVQQDRNGRLRLASNAAIPPLPPGYVLVKTFAVALNPSDHKIANGFPLPGAYSGTDFCGRIVRLAESIDPAQCKLGDMVCGAAFQFSPSHRLASGAFAEYVRVRADLLLRVPSLPTCPCPILGPLEAATLMTALSTCILAFWSIDALDLAGTPESPVTSENPIPVLVYGGSTATGTIAVQLLKLSGYQPIATCSPHNYDLVLERGASAVFNYAATDVSAQIKTYTVGKLKYVLDCISSTESASTCYQSIQRPGGRYVSLERIPPAELLVKRKAVRATFVLAAETMNESIELGKEGYDRPANKEKYTLAVRHLKMLQNLINNSKLRAHPAKILPGGLEEVVEGLQILAANGVSGKKLVALVE